MLWFNLKERVKCKLMMAAAISKMQFQHSPILIRCVAMSATYRNARWHLFVSVCMVCSNVSYIKYSKCISAFICSRCDYEINTHQTVLLQPVMSWTQGSVLNRGVFGIIHVVQYRENALICWHFQMQFGNICCILLKSGVELPWLWPHIYNAERRFILLFWIAVRQYL